VLNVPIIGNVRSTANNVEAEFYFEIYKRDDLGNEVSLGDSDKTLSVTSQTYSEFNANALLNNGEFVATDRLVFKFFADKTGSVDGTFQFQYGGSTPVRVLLNVPIAATLQAERLVYDNTISGLTATNVQTALDEIDGDLDNHIAATGNVHGATPSDIGAAPAVHTHVLTDVTGLINSSTNKIEASLIPFQFDDVLQFADVASFPATGEEGKLYIDLSSNDLYRWNGTQYITVVEAVGNLGEIPDVILTNPVSGEFLRYDGTNWVNDEVPIPDITTEFAAGVIETNDTSNLKFWRGTQAEFDALTAEDLLYANEIDSQGSVVVDITPYTFTGIKNNFKIVYAQASPQQIALDNGVYGPGWSEDATAPAGSVSVTDGTRGLYIVDDGGNSIEIFGTGTGFDLWNIFYSSIPDPDTHHIITDALLAPESINDLGDVNIGTITNNDGIANNNVLYYNETAQEWQAKEISRNDVGLSAVQNYGIANTTEAVDDTNNSKYMTPYTTYLAIYNPDVFNITLSSGSWSGSSAPYTQTITTTGMTANDNPFADINLSSVTYANVADVKTAWALLYRGTTGSNQVTFYADDVPSTNIPVIIRR
jgi:hypothetical protein